MPRLPAAFRSALRRIPGARALAELWHNPDFAALAWSQRRGRALAVLQPWTTSDEDRYPALFDALAANLARKDAPRILSFGCSGGEEVRALRRRMPGAAIIGVDVNPRALARARRADRHPGSAYHLGDSPPPGEPFDAVLALAVFRHGALERDGLDSSADVLPFARAAEVFARIDAALKPGGLLAFGNANFRIADLPGGDHYALVSDFPEELAPSFPLFGTDDRRIDGAHAVGGLFRKRG